MSRSSAWARVVLLAVAAATAPALAVDVAVGEYRGRRVLIVQDEKPGQKHPRGGSILSGDARKFHETLTAAGRIDEVLFNSRGGSERDGLEIGRIIRRSGLSTRIPAGATCASACADAFLGGVARRVEDGGRYGIHMPTIAGDADAVRNILGLMKKRLEAKGETGAQQLIFEIEKLSAQAASRWASYVLQMGASPRIVDVGTRYLASEMNWLSRADLIDLNVVNVDN